MATATVSSSALEKHASFFDPQGTHRITCGQTYDGMKRLGVPFLLRVLLTPVINGFLGLLTGGPPFVIEIDRIEKGKHPFDSGTFDDAGGFDAGAFGVLFPPGRDAITAAEMDLVITDRGDRRPQMGRVAGFLGHLFSKAEVAVLFRVASDTTKTVNGKPVPAMTRDALRSFYDGTLFDRIAARRR
ncbi:MAG TPA: caleosin family protein [Polyangiaceae bacterium]